MHYVYILKSRKDNRLYIGYTSSVVKRLREHKSGKVFNTKSRLPIELIYYEAYNGEEEARERERRLKQFGSSYSGLIKRLGLK